MSLLSVIAASAAISALITRVITSDKLTDPIRRRTRGILKTFLSCPKCAGFWATIGIFAGAWYTYGGPVLAYAGSAAATNLTYAGIVATMSTIAKNVEKASAMAQVYLGVEPVDEEDES